MTALNYVVHTIDSVKACTKQDLRMWDIERRSAYGIRNAFACFNS